MMTYEKVLLLKNVPLFDKASELALSDLISVGKEKILKELALFGISKETLFCDSIDVVCESIKGKFEQKVRGQKQW